MATIAILLLCVVLAASILINVYQHFRISEHVNNALMIQDERNKYKEEAKILSERLDNVKVKRDPKTGRMVSLK